jgi:hypothetical protein
MDLGFILFVSLMLIGNVLKQERGGVDKIFCAVFGYILLGLLWALIYGAIELTFPGSFSGTVSTAHNTAPHFAAMDQFINYSLVTLSTPGYGDITTVTHAARSPSSTEALVGKLYMAILVARLIGLHLIEARKGGD